MRMPHKLAGQTVKEMLVKVSGKRGTLVRLGAPVAVLALLTGCGELTPGTASVVNGHRITVTEVDDLVKAQCTGAEQATRQGQDATMALPQVRQRSLGLLIDSEVNRQFAEARHLTPDPRFANGFFAQFQSSIQSLPESARAELTKVFREWARGRAILVAAGSRATGQAADPSNYDQMMKIGFEERSKWLGGITIDTDPRYGPGKDGFPSGNGSISRPVSDYAKKASASQADPSWLASLPASQKCG